LSVERLIDFPVAEKLLDGRLCSHGLDASGGSAPSASSRVRRRSDAPDLRRLDFDETAPRTAQEATTTRGRWHR
jgi:hypothetical protein